jgi:probable rRNA maturation factor
MQPPVDVRSAGEDATPAPSEDPEPPSRPGGALLLDLVGLDDGWDDVPDAEQLIAAAATALASHAAIAAHLPAEACVAVSRDAEVRALNRDWRRKDRPTNVLSFPTPADAPREPHMAPFLGDVVLARETVLAEARELSIPAAHHLQHLTIHGLLHLLGFDHEDEATATEMEALETAILATLGVPDPYATQPTP